MIDIDAERVAKTEVEPDGPCAEEDGCPTEGAVLKREWRAMRKELAETRALVVQNSAEDRADAERYRWLRSQPNDTSVPRIDVVQWIEDDESANAGAGLRLEALDSAIDAAIQSLTHPTETPR